LKIHEDVQAPSWITDYAWKGKKAVQGLGAVQKGITPALVFFAQGGGKADGGGRTDLTTSACLGKGSRGEEPRGGTSIVTAWEGEGRSPVSDRVSSAYDAREKPSYATR